MLNFARIFIHETLYLKLHLTDPHVSCQTPSKYISWQNELIFFKKFDIQRAFISNHILIITEIVYVKCRRSYKIYAAS